MRPDLPLPLDHLVRLTDCFGVIQHATHALPDYKSGYTTDDNARALAVAVKHYHLHGDQLSRELATRCLAFLMFAQREDGRFQNFIGYDRRYCEEAVSEDAFGQAFSALGLTLHTPPQPGLVGPAERMFHQAIPWVDRMEHPRARALCIIALYWWSKADTGDARRARETAYPLAQYLVSRYREHSRPDWDWILPELTYSNAKLPEALFRAYQMTSNDEFLSVARHSLNFLYEKSILNDVLYLVGNDGWYTSHERQPALYDQQPVDAAALVNASLAAYEATGETGYLHKAWLSYEWFFGRNLRGESLYDPETGGCFDALTANGVNHNRGAESTICLLLAHLSIYEARQQISLGLLSGRPEEMKRVGPPGIADVSVGAGRA